MSDLISDIAEKKMLQEQLEKARVLEDRVERRMGEYPKVTLAAAAILGVLVGWMIKRR